MQISKSALCFGVMGLSLLVTANPAAAKDKAPKLAHTHLTLKSTQAQSSPHGRYKAAVLATLRAKNAGLAAEPVELFQRVKGGAAKWVDTGVGATTDSNGAASFAFVQTETKGQYRVEFAGDTTYAPSHSGTITIHRAQATTSGA